MSTKTIILSNNALTRKQWAKDLFVRIQDNVEFNYLTGSKTTDIVQIRSELGKGEGDQITFGIQLPLVEDGQVGRETVEGNEEEQRFKDFKMTIEELNKAVDTGGKMEQQRIPYDLMETGRNGLQEWWGQRLSLLAINTLAGNSSYVFNGRAMDATATAFAQPIEEPDVGHFLAVGQTIGTAVATAEAAITSSDTITLTFLDALKQLAENPYYASGFKLRPLMLKGKNYFRVVLHDYVFDALRQDTNTGQWGDLIRSAGKLQVPQVEIEYNGLLISKSNKMPQIRKDTTDSRAGVYRAVLLGAQAACWAWGGAGESKSSIMSFIPYTKDAKRFTMIRGGGIFGMKKTRFGSDDGEQDYGVITASSWGAPIDNAA